MWFEADQPRQEQTEHKYRFDFDSIHELVQLIDAHNRAWQDWFTSVAIQPHAVRYEELASDPVGVTRGILDFLGLRLPPRREILIRHRRLADEVNAQWIDRYRVELAKH